MGDLRSELEQITARFVSTVLAAARSAPLEELAAEAKVRVGKAPSKPRNVRTPVATDMPRGVRGAPTALKRAIEWQRQLAAGQVRSRAAIARREGLTRARVTQIMNLLRK